MLNRIFLLIILGFSSNVSFTQIVNVSTANQLKNALNNALAGQTIVIADGVYNLSSGVFNPPIGVDGTATQPITVKGSRNAVLTTGDSAHGYGFWLKGNKYWVLKGFTTRFCKNGVLIDSSQYITIDSVQSVRNGQSGISLRKYSSYCTVKNCYVDSCGILVSGEGEGIYIGSAYSNWCTNTNCNPDTCNYNKILNNSFGDHISSENIDIKEGTKYGLVSGNILNGNGLSNINGGDSWIDVKGNYYTIELNTGNNTYLDGFQTHIQQPGWGNYNTFRQNTLHVNASGYGVRVLTSNTNGTALNNIVCNTNIVTGASLGLTNISKTTCAVLANELLNWDITTENADAIFKWKVADISQLQNFNIEQSTDGQQFKSFAVIGVDGLQYNIPIKTNQLTGTYFRLALNKKDGSKYYSTIIHLDKAGFNAVKVFKSNNALVIVNTSNENIQLRLLGIQGKILFTATVQNGSNYLYPSFSNGIYFAETIGKISKKKQVTKIVW